MKRSIFEMHWQYYLSIEKMLVETNQYVTHSDNNKIAYSDEFASIILLSCSELDSLLKQLCIQKGIISKSNYYKMKDYAKALENSRDWGLATGINIINDDHITVFPFNKINSSLPYANLIWWKDYQSIKHDRIKNVIKGNLLNAVNSVAAQYIILRQLIEFIDESSGKEYIREKYWSDYWIPVV